MSKARVWILISLAVLAVGPLRAGGIVDESTEQTYSVGEHPTLTVRNTDGRIYVYGAEDNQITVKVYKRAFTRERLAKIAAQVSVEGDAMTVDTSYPPIPEGLFADRSGTVEYTFLVPPKCVVRKLELSQGEIHVEGLSGEGVDVALTNGRINVLNCFAPMRISLGSGGIEFRYNWWQEAPFSLIAEVKKGDLSFHFPPMAALRIDAATQSGHIRNEVRDEDGSPDVQTLQTNIGAGSEVEFKVRTGDGNIQIAKSY